MEDNKIFKRLKTFAGDNEREYIETLKKIQNQGLNMENDFDELSYNINDVSNLIEESIDPERARLIMSYSKAIQEIKKEFLSAINNL